MNQSREHDSATLMTSLFICGSLLTILFLAFSWGSSLVKYTNLDFEIRKFHEENIRIDKENASLNARLRYLQSPQYRDKWAKQHEGLAQPGEKVLVVEFGSFEPEIDPNANEALIEREILLAQPNREQWKLFFFGDR